MQRPVVADLLHRRQRRRPVDRAVERHEVVVGPAAVVVHVRRRSGAPRRSRSRRRGRRPCARGRNRGRCRRRLSSSTSSTKCTSEPARDSSFGITSTRQPHAERLGQLLQLLDAAARPVAAVARPPWASQRGTPRCATSTLKRDAPRDLQRALGFGDRAALARRGSRWRSDQRRPPAAGREALADRRVHAVQLRPASASHCCRSATAAGL